MKLNQIAEDFSKHSKTSDVSLRVSSELTGTHFYYSERDSELPNFIASTTKTMLAAIFMTMVEEGLLRLDDQLSRFLSKNDVEGLNRFGGVDRSGGITLRDLLSNQSGIPNYFAKKALKAGSHIPEQTRVDTGWSFEEAIGLAKTMEAKFLPGSGKVEYSFTNFQILSEVLEKVSGDSLKNVFQARLFDKLGMASATLFTRDDAGDFDSYSKMLFDKYSYHGAMRMGSLRGEGAVAATTEDVMKFSKGLFEGKLLTDSSLAELTSNPARLLPGVYYGLGTMLISPPRVLTGFKKVPQLIGHSGATGHFMFFEPETKTHLVGTVNQIGNPLLGMRLLLKASAALF